MYMTMPASEVARRMNTTKNAIIGLMDRCGVSKVSAPPRPRQITTDGCRWPIGEPGDQGFRFCGADRVPHVWCDNSVMDSYCQEHLGRAYLWGKAKIAAPPTTPALVLIASGLPTRVP